MLIVVLILISAIGVLVDAKKIGFQRGTLTGLWRSGPWEWFAATLFIWILAFPLYLFGRRKYIRHLQDANRLKSGFGRRFNYFGAAIIVLMAFSVFGMGEGHDVPSCEDAATTAKSAISDLLTKSNIAAEVRAIVNPQESGRDKETGARICKATLITTAGEDRVMYLVKWQDASRKLFYVEAHIQ